MASALILVLVASSILNYVYLDTVAGRTSLYGLLAVALTALGTFIGVRGFDRDPAQRRKDFIRAGVLLGFAALLWLLLIDVFIFTDAAGPGVAAICAPPCLPTTAFGLWLVLRIDPTHKHPSPLLLPPPPRPPLVATHPLP